MTDHGSELPIDRAFREFVQTQDAAALAAVFDAAAPRLLLVAMHLTRDVADAEDLVQTTFLEAIRGAERFDAARPVLPWLVTILTRRAADLQRRRRPELGGSDPASCEPGPAELAERRETIDAIVRAVDGLPDPYHEVLALRFVHGLKVVEIARALRRPVGTVHAQLHRGLAMVRRALPNVVAGSVAALAMTERGLAAVRAEVMRAAPAAAPVVAAGWLSGRAVAVVAAALLVSAGVVLAVRPEPAAGPAVGLATGAVASARASGTEPDTIEREVTPEAGALAVRERSGDPEPDPEDASAVRFSGRCVAMESGEPLAGVEIFFRQQWQETQHARMTGGVFELVEERLVTGADGRFEFAARLVARTGYSLLLRRADRVHRGGRWADLDAPRRFDFGDVAMAQGARLSGRLVDARGEPFAGSVHVLQDDTSSVRLGDGECSGQLGVGFARADGWFHSANSAIPIGTWQLCCDWGPVLDPATITVTHETQEVNATVVVARRRPLATVTGTLVDSSGSPIAGVVVGAWPGDDPRSCDQQRTDEHGRFALRLHHEHQRHDVRLDVAEQPPHGWIVRAPVQRVPWGSRDVEVVVDRPLEVELEVVDAATDEPVEQYGVRVSQDGGPGALLHVGEHPGGRTKLDCVAPGKVSLTVLPGRRDLRVTRRTFDVEATTRSLRIEIGAGAPLEVRVTLDGVGVPGVRLHVIEEASRYHEREDPAAQAGDPRALFGSVFGSVGEHAFDDSAVTDAVGFATVRVNGQQPDQGVYLFGPAVQPQVVAITEAVLARGFLPVAAEAGARVSGRVTDPELARSFATHVEALPSLGEGYASPSRIGRGGTRRARIAPDGSFDLPGLTPGRWRIGYSSGSVSLPSDPLIVVDLEAGDQESLLLDPSRLRPGRVTATVTFDGAPPPAGSKVWLACVREEGAGELRCETTASADVLPDGTVEFELVPPGRYRLRASSMATGHRRTLFATEPLVVAAGEHVRAACDLRPWTMRIEVHEADGRVVPPREWFVFGAWGDVIHDERSRLAYVHPEIGVTIRFRGHRLGPFHLPAGQPTHDLVVTLPR